MRDNRARSMDLSHTIEHGMITYKGFSALQSGRGKRVPKQRGYGERRGGSCYPALFSPPTRAAVPAAIRNRPVTPRFPGRGRNIESAVKYFAVSPPMRLLKRV